MNAPAPAAALGPRDLLSALAVVVLWGLNFVVMKWGLRSFTPFQLGVMRYLFAALPWCCSCARPGCTGAGC